jgi:hypothetical protein
LKVTDNAWPGAEEAETTVKRLLCCGFQHTGKAMTRVYQCWWRLCREINVFSKFKYHVICFISICDLFIDSSSYMIGYRMKCFPAGVMETMVLIIKYRMILQHFHARKFTATHSNALKTKWLAQAITSYFIQQYNDWI